MQVAISDPLCRSCGGPRRTVDRRGNVELQASNGLADRGLVQRTQKSEIVNLILSNVQIAIQLRPGRFSTGQNGNFM